MSEPRTYTIYLCPDCGSRQVWLYDCSISGLPWCHPADGPLPHPPRETVPVEVGPVDELLAQGREQGIRDVLAALRERDRYFLATDFLERTFTTSPDTEGGDAHDERGAKPAPHVTPPGEDKALSTDAPSPGEECYLCGQERGTGHSPRCSVTRHGAPERWVRDAA